MNTFNLRTIATIAAAVLLLGAAENTRAGLITFGFEATIEGFGFGESLTGSYTFDSNTPNTTPDTGLLGTYPGAIVAMDIAVGALTASATELGNIIVNAAAGQYQVTPAIPMSGDTVADTTLVSFGFALVGVPLTSDGLPTSPPQVWSISLATLGFEQSGGPGLSFGGIDSLTSVPEPATVFLLGLALIAGAPVVYRRARG